MSDRTRCPSSPYESCSAGDLMTAGLTTSTTRSWLASMPGEVQNNSVTQLWPRWHLSDLCIARFGGQALCCLRFPYAHIFAYYAPNCKVSSVFFACAAWRGRHIAEIRLKFLSLVFCLNQPWPGSHHRARQKGTHATELLLGGFRRDFRAAGIREQSREAEHGPAV